MLKSDNIDLKCPVCGYSIETGIYPVCPNCGYELSIEQNNLPWVNVFTVSTEVEAEMFKANLQSAGIPVQILSQRDRSQVVTLGDLAVVKIFVPSALAPEAYKIIQYIENNKFDTEDNSNEDSFDI